jgi:hypothetical protein
VGCCARNPSSTHGKVAKEAKALELKGWPYPRHLAGRFFGVAVHGDSIGAESLRRALTDWLTDMALVSAGGMAETDGYIGYMRPSTSHAALDENTAFQEEVRNVARALGRAVILAREGRFEQPGTGNARSATQVRLDVQGSLCATDHSSRSNCRSFSASAGAALFWSLSK